MIVRWTIGFVFTYFCVASAKDDQFSGDTGLAHRDENLILRDVSTFEGPIAGALSDHGWMKDMVRWIVV
jgi:hypothetical protein